MDLSKAIGIFVLALLAINVFLFHRLGSAPNLGHRVRWRRWLHRALAYPVCHGISIALAAGVLDQLANIIPTQVEAVERNPWMMLLVLPLPFSLTFMKLAIWIQRSAFGYEHWPKPPAPPAWIPARPRMHDFESIDLRDDELVQELARSHWTVMHEALLRNCPLYEAQCLQQAFVDYHLQGVEASLADRATSIYQQEMIAQALSAEAQRAAAQAAHGQQRSAQITEENSIF